MGGKVGKTNIEALQVTSHGHIGMLFVGKCLQVKASFTVYTVYHSLM